MNSKWDSSWPLEPKIQLTHDDYTVAWLCALPIEIEAAENILDEMHLPPPQPEFDKNIYIFGSICGHNVVIGWPDTMGSTATTIMATRVDQTFRNLKFGLLVGIAAGIPENGDIRLGDVVISKRDGMFGGVGAHDRGKVTSNGFVQQTYLNGVPEVLGKAVQRLESMRRNKINTYILASSKRNPDFSDFERPLDLDDNLFDSDYIHINKKDKQCLECDKQQVIKNRKERKRKNESVVHFGTVASGNQVIKTGVKRTEIAGIHEGFLAIEMEAAGLMDIFGCATIRGICNYADSHNNDGWHKYAAAAAAAVAKETLGIIPVGAVSNFTTKPVADFEDFEKLEFDNVVILLLKSSGVKENQWDEHKKDAGEVVHLGQHAQANSTYGDVYATFAASTNFIVEQAKLDPAYHAALELFDVLGYMHFNGIVPEVWERATKNSQAKDIFDDGDDINILSSWHKSFLPTFLRTNGEASEQKLLLRKAINILTSFSLINEQKNSILAMHPLAHAWARYRLSTEDGIQAWATSAVILSLARGNLIYDIFWRQLKMHVTFCMQKCPQAAWNTYPRIEIGRMFYGLCYLLNWAGDDGVALGGFKSILKQLKFVKGSTNWILIQERIAIYLRTLGLHKQELEIYKEMESFVDRVWTGEKQKWWFKTSFAYCYRRQNEQHNKAKSLLKQVICQQKAKLDPAARDLMNTLSTLALVYNDLGNHRKAIKIQNRIVNKRIEILDRTHPDLPIFQYNLGRSYLRYGMPTKAIEILEVIVEVQKEVLRPTDVNFLDSQQELAHAFAICGNYDKAIELMEAVVSIRKQTMDPGHEARLRSEFGLGRYYLETNSFRKAVDILEKVVQSGIQLPKFYVDIRNAKVRLGRAHLGSNVYSKAILIFEEALAADKANNYNLYDESCCLETRWFLAIAYTRVSRKDDALQLLQEAVDIHAERKEPTDSARQDFEKLLERCQENFDEPLGSEFEKERQWSTYNYRKIPEELSDCSSISSDDYVEDEVVEEEFIKDEVAKDEVIEDIEDDQNISASIKKIHWWRCQKSGTENTTPSNSGKRSRGKSSTFRKLFLKSRRERDGSNAGPS